MATVRRLVITAILIAGCDDALVDPNTYACLAQCTEGSCAIGEDCASAGVYGGFAPQCLKRCWVSGDCGAEGHCIVLADSLDTAHCVTEAIPAPCELEGICDPMVAPHCEGSVSVTAYRQKSGATCGPEYVECGDAGCVDGGGCAR